MKKTHFQTTMENLSCEKEGYIQKLILLSYDELQEMEKYYYDLYESCKDMGYFEAEVVHYFKRTIIAEAVKIKQDNEKQTWD